MTTYYEVMVQEESQKFIQEEATKILRNITVARNIFPVVPLDDASVEMYEFVIASEYDASQSGYQLKEPKYSSAYGKKYQKPLLIHQVDVKYSRHEMMQVMKDILTLDDRQRIFLGQLNTREERIMIAGDGDLITSLADETNNVTDMTTSLDMGTYAEYTVTFETAITEAKTDIKDEYYREAEKHILWTPDVAARARATFSTVNDDKNIMQYTAKRLAQENGVQSDGSEFVHESGYLGSTTGGGTTNSALICKHKELIVMPSSGLEFVVDTSNIKGMDQQFAVRSTPIFKKQEAVHYDSATATS